MKRAALLLCALLFALAALALSGCDTSGPPASRLNIALNTASLAFSAALLALVVVGIRRQHTRTDDVEGTIRRALAGHATSARYTYTREAPSPAHPVGRVVYGPSFIDPGFPLDWHSGYLAGRTSAEMIPDGPTGDEARTVYAGVLERAEAGSYLRTEVGMNGRTVTIRYRHVPLPDGSGAAEAVPLSPEIDHARDERDALRLRLAETTARLQMCDARAAASGALAVAERTLGIRPDAGPSVPVLLPTGLLPGPAPSTPGPDKP